MMTGKKEASFSRAARESTLPEGEATLTLKPKNPKKMLCYW